MNRNILIAVGAIVLLGIGWWIFSSPKMSTDETAQTTEKTTTTIPPATGSQNTFTNILSQKGNYECVYEKVTTSGQSRNVIFISDGKLRAEFRTAGTAGSMMVYDGANLYVWKEGAVVGTKTQLKSISELPAVIPQDLTSGTVLGSGLDSVSWDCHPWSKVDTSLVAPAEVKFSSK